MNVSTEKIYNVPNFCDMMFARSRTLLNINIRFVIRKKHNSVRGDYFVNLWWWYHAGLRCTWVLKDCYTYFVAFLNFKQAKSPSFSILSANNCAMQYTGKWTADEEKKDELHRLINVKDSKQRNNTKSKVITIKAKFLVVSHFILLAYVCPATL